MLGMVIQAVVTSMGDAVTDLVMETRRLQTKNSKLALANVLPTHCNVHFPSAALFNAPSNYVPASQRLNVACS